MATAGASSLKADGCCGGKTAQKKFAGRDPERTRAGILAAAAHEFMEKGYGGARIDAIAGRSGFNKRMIYHYFGDKESLYLTVLESAYVRIRSAEDGLKLDDIEPVDAIRKLVQFTWAYFLKNPDFLSILNTENLHKARYLKRSARIFNLHSTLVSRLSKILSKGIEQGVFRKDSEAVNVYITIAAVGAFYLSNRWTLSTIFRRNLNETAQLRAWGEHIEHVILGYLRE